jgi:hypothetical protein
MFPNIAQMNCPGIPSWGAGYWGARGAMNDYDSKTHTAGKISDMLAGRKRRVVGW